MVEKLKATEEQLTYARVLDLGMKIGLLILIVFFIIYVTGILPSYIPVNDLPKYWKLSVHQYLDATGIQQGWTWLKLLNRGDFLNFFGIAFLAGVTIICYIAVIPIFFRKKDKVYGVLAIIEVLVLLLAASGVLKTGGH
ncbi:MAG: hypothetical protein HXY53_01580 [Nitrospirae bacterium]|nr:hypothetical protein [Nitrospirota bacterium]